jgi:hypothetical protein
MNEPHREQRAMFIGLAAGSGWSHAIRRIFNVETVELWPAHTRAKFTVQYHYQPDGSVVFLRGVRHSDTGRRTATFPTPRAARDALAAMIQRLG